ncbi:hypothetical protein [Swaminathania salitolerans]|uniref:hypothetical protein n=1 Tax=Swaminathania salitolerans TaxID=182838 RepID=UPI0011BDFA11|nr:hypothetical protein [Swaminathania salitolerans]
MPHCFPEWSGPVVIPRQNGLTQGRIRIGPNGGYCPTDRILSVRPEPVPGVIPGHPGKTHREGSDPCLSRRQNAIAMPGRLTSGNPGHGTGGGTRTRHHRRGPGSTV